MVREPVTALTDFALAAITAFWAVRVFRTSDQRASRLFAWALTATAASTAIGGVYHLFPSEPIWKMTALSVGLVSFLLGLSIATAFLSPSITRLIARILLVQLCLYAIAVVFTDDFWLLIVDYGSVMIAILILCFTRWSNRAARWITAAILVSFAASAVQITSIRLGPLNHNDIYHLVEVVGLYCFYRGGMVVSSPVQKE